MAGMKFLIAGSALVLVLLVSSGSAIRCFSCNSHDDPACMDDIPPEALAIDCDRENGEHQMTFCRKINQVIEFSVNNLPADTRVIRTCAWDDSTYKNKCYSRHGFGGRQIVCACDTDTCNAAGSIQSTIITLSVGLLALTTYFVRF